MNILVAFDKFKDSMTAATACSAAESGVRKVFGDEAVVTHAPLTDGGEGFCPILTTVADGYLEHHTVSGPQGEDVEAPIGWVDLETLPESILKGFGEVGGKLAIIEMASAAGLEQVPADQRHPKHCTTRGIGELIRIAVAKNAGAILLGIGGSATSDLGLGALEALGIQFPDTKRITPEKWVDVTSVTGFIDLKLPPIFIAGDVDNPLLGERGAAAVYGPQKGLQPNEIEAFDADAERLADLLCLHFGPSMERKEAPASGAAGGMGCGLKVACGAEFVPGFELVQSWLDREMKVAIADLVLTGEGKFDTSSLAGKGPYSLIESAAKAGTPVIVLAGKAENDAAAAITERFPNNRVYSVTPDGWSLVDALAHGATNLETTAEAALGEFQKRDG